MAAQDPNTIAANWATRLGQSTQKITDGINAVQVAPGQAAARQKQVWLNNITASADKWASNTAAVSLQDWQQAAITKGVSRIASGAQAAQPKFAQFMTKLLPFVNSAVAGLPARGDLETNIARSAAFSRKMATFRNA